MIRKINFIILICLLVVCSYGKPLEEAHDFAIYNIKGERFIFYDMLRKLPIGGSFIINFTSIYCKPCKKEIPELSSILSKSSKPVRLICIYSEIGEPVKKLAKELGVFDQAYVDPFGNIRKLFSISKIPVTIIIKKDHTISARFEGYSKENIVQIEKIVNDK